MPPRRKKVHEAEPEHIRLARMQGLLLKFLMLKGHREGNVAKLNKFKLGHSLRALMRDVKLEDLYKDIEILSQTFERIVDRKDNVIKGLTESIQLAEEQHRIALSGHLAQIEKFIEIQKERLAVLQKDFSKTTNDMFDDFNHQNQLMMRTHLSDMENTEDLNFALETMYLTAEHEYTADFRSRMDEIRNKNADERNYMKFQLEHQMEQTWHQMQATLHEYNESTEDRRRGYNNLLEKDEKNGRLINLQMIQIQNTTETITRLKEKMTDMLEQHRRKTGNLVEDQELMKKHFQQLKTHLKKVDQHHKDCLLNLATITNRVMTQLKQRVTEAEKIIRLGEMCKKYETEEERLIPFYPTSYTDEELEELNELENEPFLEPLAAMAQEYKGLENFWKRYNKVYLDKLCLEKEQMVLTKENERLCQMLRQYLSNITVLDDTIDREDNTLLMINKEIKLHFQTVPTTEHRVRRVQTAVIDAAYVARQNKYYA